MAIKNKHIRLFIAVLMLCIMSLPAGKAAVAQIFVRDADNRELVFSSPPQKVVSLVPSATEILFEIGAGSAVTGLTYHDATLAGAGTKTVVGGFFMPSVERVVSLEPDLVILSSLHEAVRSRLDVLGIPMFVHDTQSIAQSFEMIKTLGRLFGKESRALAVVRKNRAELDHIQKKLASAVPGPRKRVIRLMGRDRVMTPGNDSFQNELIRLAGGVAPDFGKKGGAVTVTKAEWTAFNPQVIYGCGGDRQAAETFFSRPGWDRVDAVKNGQIFYFPCELTCRAAAHSGYFVSWLSSVIYTDAFADPARHVLGAGRQEPDPLEIDLDYVQSAGIRRVTVDDFENKTLMIDFKQPQTIVSTLEGQRENILSVGNHYSPPPTWGPGHKLGIDHIRSAVLAANGKDRETTAFLITGADMGNLSVQQARFKEMKVVALVTAGVMSNAMRMSRDTGMFYEPGTINTIIMTNTTLSDRAMTRAIIAATEAKTAALEDLDIRSTYTPRRHGATGTGTDNVMVVKGRGVPVKNSGGHTKMGELIAAAVYDGVRDAVLKQNGIRTGRHIFQRLKERKISVGGLISGRRCDCLNRNDLSRTDISTRLEHLLLEKEYAAFIESALAVSDGYEKGLIRDLSLFRLWCREIASRISGTPVAEVRDLLTDPEIPPVLRTALNAMITGILSTPSPAVLPER